MAELWRYTIIYIVANLVEDKINFSICTLRHALALVVHAAVVVSIISDLNCKVTLREVSLNILL
jgi:hypothetical protein